MSLSLNDGFGAADFEGPGELKAPGEQANDGGTGGGGTDGGATDGDASGDEADTCPATACDGAARCRALGSTSVAIPYDG